MNLGEALSSIGTIPSIDSINNKDTNTKLNTDDQSSFQDILNNSLEKLNSTQLEGYNAMQNIATGKVENLADAIHQIEKAELSLKFALEVKNKAINAYKEITKMQI